MLRLICLHQKLNLIINTEIIDFKFWSQGYQYCFISNIDNLGATVDINILELLMNDTAEPREYVIEITDKTRADIKVQKMYTKTLKESGRYALQTSETYWKFSKKLIWKNDGIKLMSFFSFIQGGTIIQYENKLRLLELIQVPNEHIEDFKSVKYFKYFNTNNIWIQLSGIYLN